MKKYIAIGISLVIALSLTACGQPTQEQQEPGESQEVQQAGPVETETTSQTIDVQQTGGTPGEATPLGEEAQNIEEEAGTVDEAGAVDEAGTTDEDIQSSEIQLFTDVNETVYATGTVNIRSSWSASSDRLGSLSAGQSVTRTGTSIKGTEAEGWSRVQLSDGTTAYISNSYLSTTKPVQQQSTPSTPSTPSSSSQSTTTTSQPSTTTSTPSTSQPSSSSSSSGSVWDQAFYDSLTPDQQAAYQSSSDQTRVQMKAAIESHRQLEEQGYYGNGETTAEANAEDWSQIHVGS